MEIKGQCSETVKSKLATLENYQTLEKTRDVVGLMAELKEMAFSAGGVRHPMMALQEMMRKLIGINQGKEETLTHYYTRFMAITQVIEEKWGPFYPVKQVKSKDDDDIKQARDSMLTMIFLAGADTYR